MKICLWGHSGNIHKQDHELVHVSPTRSREMARSFANLGHQVTAAVYWPDAAQRLSENLEYKHIDQIEVADYDVVFCHLILSIQQISDLACGKKITAGSQLYGNSPQQFQAILDHPRKYLQLDAPRALDGDAQRSLQLVHGVRCIGVATANGVPKWRKMYPKSHVEWVNAATIAYRYPKGPTDPYPQTGKPRVLYLGRMNDASAVTPLDKLHKIAALLPNVEFHIVTNKIRDSQTDKVYAINELQTGSGREIRFHHAANLIKAPNIFLHRGSTYAQSFDWMHYADCAVGFAVRPDQDVASCKTWEYYGVGIPCVLEEGTPEVWVLNKVHGGEVVKYGDWQGFADKIQLILDNKGKYKRRKMREYIAKNHGYDNRARQWLQLMEKYQ